MTNKRIKLPKEGFIEAEQPGTGGTRLEEGDVEGHSFATPAPPSLMPSRSPSQGGEFIADDDETDETTPSGLRLKV
jgi:hypothetical protein